MYKKKKQKNKQKANKSNTQRKRDKIGYCQATATEEFQRTEHKQTKSPLNRENEVHKFHNQLY